MQKRILSGSRAFFSQIEEFNSKDFDYVIIDDSLSSVSQRYIHYKEGEDVFVWPLANAEELIDNVKDNQNNAFEICFFLIPEVIDICGFTIEHLKRLKRLRESLGRKHEYLGLIYDYYIYNNSFTLTDEQRLAAYREYKRYRN